MTKHHICRLIVTVQFVNSFIDEVVFTFNTGMILHWTPRYKTTHEFTVTAKLLGCFNWNIEGRTIFYPPNLNYVVMIWKVFFPEPNNYINTQNYYKTFFDDSFLIFYLSTYPFYQHNWYSHDITLMLKLNYNVHEVSYQIWKKLIIL